MAKLVCHGEKYTKGAISKIERHNERQNEHYGNQDIDLERSHLNYKLLEAEVRELSKFKQLAEKFLAEHGLKDYFRKAFIYSNNQEL